MKKRLILILCCCIIFMVCSTLVVSNKKKSDNMEKVELDALKLNHIAVSAGEYEFDEVKIGKNAKKKLKNKVDVYKVSAKEYTDDMLKKIANESIGSKVTNIINDDSVKLYQLSNGGEITYYKNSGSVTYNYYKDNESGSVTPISGEKLKRTAQKFIRKTNLWNLSDIEFVSAKSSLTMENADGEEEIIRYEVMFIKKAPEGIAGFEGTGPGIIVELDCKGKVVGFVSIDKNYELYTDNYPGKKLVEMENDIESDRNVMVYSNNEDDSIDSDVEIDDIEYVLYSDSIDEVQDYMVTHYKCIDNDAGANFVLPAVDDSYIEIKR